MVSDQPLPIVYIAGPYRAERECLVLLNIMAAHQAAKVVWQSGGVPYCPHLNSAFMGGLVPDETFLLGDLIVLRKCDAVLAIHGWESSAGARSEINLARRLVLPVFTNEVNLRAWIALHKKEPA